MKTTDHKDHSADAMTLPCEKKSVAKEATKKEIRLELIKILQAKNPHPRSELNYSNAFELLCAVMLSAQATDVSVNKVTDRLFAKANTPKAMMELGEEGIASYIKSIGLWRAKAKNLAKLSQILHEKYNDIVPDNEKELVLLPGVGSKTAKVVLNVAFGHNTIAVDTHIFRVCNRTGYCTGKTPLEIQDKLPKLVPDEFKKDAHHYFLLHGRYTCKATSPQCPVCEIAHLCSSYKNGVFKECKAMRDLGRGVKSKTAKIQNKKKS